MLLLLREMSSLERIAAFNMISNNLYLIRTAMISTFVLWTPCEAVYMFLTAVQKLKLSPKQKKMCVREKRSSILFLRALQCVTMFLKSKKHVEIIGK